MFNNVNMAEDQGYSSLASDGTALKVNVPPVGQTEVFRNPSDPGAIVLVSHFNVGGLSSSITTDFNTQFGPGNDFLSYMPKVYIGTDGLVAEFSLSNSEI